MIVYTYNENQQRFINIDNKSAVPTMIKNTDDINWDEYAHMVLDKIR